MGRNTEIRYWFTSRTISEDRFLLHTTACHTLLGVREFVEVEKLLAYFLEWRKANYPKALLILHECCHASEAKIQRHLSFVARRRGLKRDDFKAAGCICSVCLSTKAVVAFVSEDKVAEVALCQKCLVKDNLAEDRVHGAGELTFEGRRPVVQAGLPSLGKDHP